MYTKQVVEVNISLRRIDYHDLFVLLKMENDLRTITERAFLTFSCLRPNGRLAYPARADLQSVESLSAESRAGTIHNS